MTSNNLTDKELIKFVFNDLAGQMIRENVPDFSDTNQWKKVVAEMSIPVATTYRIGILNSQIMNGGVIQYFDNGYGIFALETIEDLNRIGAFLTKKILDDCLNILNPKNYKAERFIKYITNREYEIYESNIQDELDELDKKYYKLNEKENLEDLIGSFLRQNEVS